MNKIIWIISGLLLLFLATPVVAKEKLAVMDLEATYGIGDDLTWALSDYLRGEIFAQGEYEVVSKADLEALAKRTSQQQQAGTCTDTACLAELGKALGTKYMVYGSISKAGKLYIISLSLLDTVGQDAGVKNRINERCTCSEEQLFDTMQRAAAKIMGKAPAKKAEAATAAAVNTIPPARDSKPGGHEMIVVKGGCFQMGDTFGDGYGDEKPVHEVCVDDFQMGKYEVTQGQWQAVMGNNPANFKKGDNYPVEKVSWNDVQEYIGKLNRQSGQNFRLPSEAEWEYACRSGGRDEKYCGGNNVDGLAWYESNSGSATHPVGTKSPNGLGLYDMSGNVWEWTNDWYGQDYYGSTPRQNPPGPSSGSARVLRGGSWRHKPWYVRSASRDRFTPDDRYYNLGFRLVLSPGQ